MSNLWQRLLRATALVFGLLVGVAVTVFAYSNTSTVNVGWATLHFNGVPLWTVAVVPLLVALAVGAVYHWLNSLHHFTEHMKHRRRVKELEAELTALRSHLDTALGMPGQSPEGPGSVEEPEPEKEELKPVEPAAVNGETNSASKKPKVVAETEPVAVATTESSEPEKPAET